MEAWPGYPDALAISNMLAEDLGDETANARLLLLKQVRGKTEWCFVFRGLSCRSMEIRRMWYVLVLPQCHA